MDIATPCPDFTLPCTPDGTLSRASLIGAPFVLFFYPRDNTPTCTAEAREFAAAAPEFAALGCKLIGCSADSISTHLKFQAKAGFDLPLISDPDHVLIGAMGCWVEKKLYGRTYMGISRSSFLFDSQGQLAAAWRNIRLKGHIAAVLDAARAL